MADVMVHAGHFRLFLEALSVTLGKGDDDFTAGIYLQTGEALSSEGSARTQALMGVTTTGAVVSRMHIACNGELRKPIMLPAEELGWLAAKLLQVSKDDKDGLVTLRVEYPDLQSKLIVETTQNASHSFMSESGQDFPIEMCTAMLDGERSVETVTDSEDMEIPAGRKTVLPGGYHSLLGTMSKKFGRDVEVFRMGHPASVHIAQIGPWRCAFPGTKYSFTDDVDAPEEQEALT